MSMDLCATIEIDGKSTKTSTRSVLAGNDTVEWEEKICLLEPLHQFKTTVGALLDGNDELHPINFSDGDAPLPCPLLKITTERRFCGVHELSEPDAMALMRELTDTGCQALLRYNQLQDERGLDEAITCFEQVRNVCPANHPHRSTVLFNLATAMFIRSQDKNDYHDLDVAIGLYRDAFQLPARNHSGRRVTALDLFFAFLACLRAQVGEIDEMNAKDSVPTVTVTYAYRAAWLALQMTGISLPIQSMKSIVSQPDDTDPDLVLIPMARAKLQDVSYQDPRRPELLAYLGIGLNRRFERNREYVESYEAISMLQYALQVIPDSPLKTPLFAFLANSLFHRFERLDDVTDLDKSISAGQVAVRLTPNGHPEKPGYLNQLGNSLCYRYRHLGNIEDIEESVSAYEEALGLIPDEHTFKPALLTNLGSSLTHRFEHFGHAADIDRSISITKKSLRDRSDSHPDKPNWLNRLGNSYFHRFHRLGDLADIDISISTFEQAVSLTPDDDPARPLRLSNLGNALSLRFEHLGDLTDIDKSIWMSEEALRLAPDGHSERPMYLSILGSSLLCRSQWFGDLSDVNKSITVQEEALRLTRSDDPDKPNQLSNLGNSLFRRFERLGDLADVDKSVLMHKAATRLTPDDHPEKASRLHNLGTSLTRRFQLLGDLADINESISVSEEANRLTPHDQPQKPGFLQSLGISIIHRFHRFGDPADVNKSISIFEECVRLTPDGHPDKPNRLRCLGRAIEERFEHFHDPSDLAAAALHFSAASRAPTGHTSSRFRAARRWISTSRLQGDSQALLDACTTAIGLLPQLAWVGLTLRERHRILLEAADVAREAAAAALESGFPEMAVEWLEQGRSIIWSQFLQLRTPVDELRVEHPNLADQFQQISKALEHAGSREDDTFHEFGNSMVGNARSIEQDVQKRHNLALRRETLLAEIRTLPHFDRFLLPKKVEEIAPLAYSGPVIYLNASKERCDALIVRAQSGTVIPVSLPGVSHQEMVVLQSVFRLLLERDRLVFSRHELSALLPVGENSSSQTFLNSLLTGDGVGSIDRAVKVKPQKIGGYTPDELFKEVLAYLWDSVVKRVLDALGFSTPPKAAKLDRIIWCPTGPFAFLPIHAAGLYDTSEAGTKLSDFAISSYIPSLGTLASSTWEDANDPSSNIRLIAVPQPASDGQSGLSCVREEIDCLKFLSSKSPLVSIHESDGCVEDVMEKMKHADWVHFACHGIQDPHEPLNSGLCLADGRRLKLSDIIRLSRPQGGLAFLSACQTAQGDEMLSEESVHLAAGMLLAGYGGVIATMWAIGDSDAPKVTKDVYGHLFRDGKVPDCAEAAEALHYGVQRLRACGVPFTSWVPFIHVGR